ncbi:MAG TPA: DUF4870 domain-containing protein [Pseudonocardia sp.]|jgi:hypothetical protein|nr:DUF4870 domain-containing protein [Pseudonocardia sp.]
MATEERHGWGGGYPDSPAGTGGASMGAVATTAEDRNWAVAAHLSAVVGAWVALGFIGPLVVLLLGHGRSAFARAHAVEALNFNLSILLYTVVGGLLVWLLGLGLLILLVAGVVWLIGTIVATVKASRGEFYRYPITIRIVH